MSPMAFATPLPARAAAPHPTGPVCSSAPSPNLDTLPSVPSRLLHVRLRLHLLQLSHQRRRQRSSTHAPLSSSADRSIDPLLFGEPSDLLPHEHPDAELPFPLQLPPISPTPSDTPTTSTSSTSSTTPSSSSSSSSSSSAPPAEDDSSSSYSASERKARSERLRSLWKDKEWRANMLAKTRSKEVSERRSEALKRLWSDESFREKMRRSRTGREAPNKGVSPSPATRMRMSNARKGIKLSDETRQRMSAAKRTRSKDDEWPRLIGESRKGKTKEYYAMRREFRALHKDLKLWSDSFRARYGRLPNTNTFERFVAPMMILRIRRYLTLRDAIGPDEADVKYDIFSKE